MQNEEAKPGDEWENPRLNSMQRPVPGSYKRVKFNPRLS